jgi:serine/threonine protein kinase/WD40 repeat protein
MNDPKTMSGPAVDAMIGQIADEFTQRLNRGEQPDIEAYVKLHPELAGVVREALTALLLVRSVPADQAASGLELGVTGAVAGCLGDFRIIRELGRGGMGVVYEAEQISLGRAVALKVLPFAATLDPRQLQRFKKEAQAAAHLHHPNIVPVYAVGCERGVHYYAMQLVDGQTLAATIHELRRLIAVSGDAPAQSADAGHELTRSLASGLLAPSRTGPADGCDEATRIANRDPTPRSATETRTPSARDPAFLRTAAYLGLQAAEALEHAHQIGVVHRDIKPANLLVDERGRLWITDFGLARLRGDAGMTMTGDLVGTLRYMSPEQALAQPVLVDHRSDIYSLGVTLYELLTLERAFPGEDRQQLLRRIAWEEPIPPRRINPAIPAELETIVLKAMAKSPAERYATAQELADDLERFLEDQPIHAKRPTWRQRASRWARRHRPTVIATGLTALALLVLATVLLAVGNERIRQEQKRTEQERDRALQAERERTLQLWQAYVAQVQARRLSRQVGQRFGSLDVLQDAARLAPSLPLSEAQVLQMRNQAIASLALPDVRFERSLPVGTANEFWVAFDEAFQRYAWGDERGAITVCRVSDGNEVSRLPAPEVAPRWLDLGFSPNGSWLALLYHFTRRPSELHVWDLASGRRTELIMPGAAGGLAFSPDSCRLAVSRGDGMIGLYDPGSGEEEKRLGQQLGNKLDLAFHPDGKRLAVSDCARGQALVLDVQSGKQLSRFPHPAGTEGLCWTDGGQLLAVGCNDQRIHVWDPASQKLQAVLDGHTNRAIHLASVPDMLVSRSWDGTTRIWDPVQGTQLLSTIGRVVGLRGDGRQLALMHFDGRLELWEVAVAPAFRKLYHGRIGNRTPRPTDWGPRRLDFSPDGRLLASASVDGVRLWDVASGGELAHLPVGLSERACFSPGGELRLITCNAEQLLCWPIRTDAGSAMPGLVIGPPKMVVSLAGAVDGRDAAWDRQGRTLVVTGPQQHQATVLNPDRPEKRIVLGPHALLIHVALSGDGKLAATTTWHGADINVWDTASGQLVWKVPSRQGTMAFSPDGQWLVTSTVEKAYRLWRIGSWEPGLVVPKLEPRPGGMAFTVDGTVLAVTDPPRGIKLIRVSTGQELATLEAPEDNFGNWVSISPDGNQLAASTGNHTIHLWDLGRIRKQLATFNLDWDQSPLPDRAIVKALRMQVIPAEPPPAK